MNAPLSGRGGIMNDKDAVYLDVEKVKHDGEREGEEFIAKMADAILQAEKNGSGDGSCWW